MVPDGPLQVKQQINSLCTGREKCKAQRSLRGAQMAEMRTPANGGETVGN